MGTGSQKMILFLYFHIKNPVRHTAQGFLYGHLKGCYYVVRSLDKFILLMKQAAPKRAACFLVRVFITYLKNKIGAQRSGSDFERRSSGMSAR